MAFIIKDRVKENTTTTGTGAVSLGGAAATFDTFQSYMVNGDTTYYAIVSTETNTDEWEVGLGTWNTGNTLTRTTVLAGSNGTNAVNFGSGNKDVFMTYPAAHAALAGDDVDFANITVTGTVDGRDVATDGTKLDTIETNADVTDAVNVAAAGALMKSGGTMTGNLILNADPTTALGAATKEYVDTIAAAGIHYHTPVRVESPDTAGNLNATYDNGTSGVGATLTNAGTQAALVIDGVTLSTNDRVLIYNQTNGYENGIYTVTNTGSASTNWVLTRATDADSYGASDPDALGEGDAYFVKEGDTGAGELYVMNTSGVITFGTTAITFTVIAETAVYSAGTGLTLDGTTFSIGQDVGTTANVTFNQVTAAIIGNVTGNVTGTVSGNAGTATKLATARTIQLSGDVTGSASFDGSANISITAAVQDDSHAHVISNVDGLQTALDAKVPTARTLTAGNGLTGGGDLTANRTFAVGAGSGIIVSADAVAHADTSSQASVNNSGRTYIQDITLDDFGHVTGLTSATETVTNTNQLTTFVVEDGDGTEVTISHGKEWKFVEGGAIDINWTNTANGTDADPFDLTISHVDTSSQASVNNSGGTVIQDVTLDTYGHVTGLASVDLDSRYVNVTGDSMSGALTIATTGVAASPSLAIDVSSSASFVHSQENLAANLASTQTNIIVIGKEGSTKNSGYLGFNWTSAGSDSNYVSLGHWGNNNLFRVYGDGTLKAGASNIIFHDGYHPNADKWTTARTNTVSLSGDVTGSGSASVDGSGNWTVSITTAVGDDSHSHSINTITDEHRIFNNMGSNHSTRTSFDASTPSYNFGWRYVQGSTNGPGTGESQFYSLYVGLGNEYLGTGASSYGMYFAVGRNSSTPYLSFRYNENNSLGTWRKVYAGRADAWTTARTNTVTLTNDVTGSGSASVDGSGNWTVSINADWQGGTANKLVNMNNYNITNVNHLTFNDPGPGEGLEWLGGSGWEIYESPNNLTTNSGGNLQFVTGTTRRMTLDTSGDLEVTGGANFGSNTLTADGQNDVFLFGTSPTSATAQSGAFYNKLRILGGSSQTRDLQLYQVDSEYAHIGSSWSSNQLTIDSNFSQVNCNTDIGVGSSSYRIALSTGGLRANSSVGRTASSDEGIFWHTDSDYSIHRTAGAWTSPTFQQLEINWPTGIIIKTASAGTYTYSHLDVQAQINANHSGDQKIVLTGSANPYIRFQEGTTNRAYIQYDATLNALVFRNQETDNFDFMPDAATGAVNIRLKGADNDIWGSVYADDNSNTAGRIGFLDDDQNWAYRITSDTSHEWMIDSSVKLDLDGGGLCVYGGSAAWSDGGNQGVTVGSIHLDPESGTDHYGSAITWGASDVGNGGSAQAGIYVRSDGTYGTKMYLSTTDSYGTGSRSAVRIDHSGHVTIFRGNLYLGNNDVYTDSLFINDIVYHNGDTNTYFGFPAEDQFVIFRGGTQRFKIDADIDMFGNVITDVNSYMKAGYFWADSDLTLKENLVKIDSAVDKVLQINGYTYNFKETPDKRAAGLIAQEVEKILPEAVNDTKAGTKALDYNATIAVLVEAIKEQQAEIQQLKNKIGL